MVWSKYCTASHDPRAFPTELPHGLPSHHQPSSVPQAPNAEASSDFEADVAAVMEAQRRELAKMLMLVPIKIFAEFNVH